MPGATLLMPSGPTGDHLFVILSGPAPLQSYGANGQFISVPWSVKAGTPLGNALRLFPNTALDLSLGGNHQLYSEFGLVLYDRQTYLNYSAPSSGARLVEGNYIFSPTNMGVSIFSAPPAFSSTTEQTDKEAWLDGNSLPLIVDRHNGSLIKGE